MLKRYIINITFVLLIALVSIPFALAQEHGEVHWGYEGEEGSEYWGEISEDWQACSLGNAQSPIDIANATPVDLKNIEVSYGDTALNIFNNGHHPG